MRASRRAGRADGPRSDRRDRRAADLHLPQPEVHRVPAQARVRPAHPRGRARRATIRRPARRRWAASSSSWRVSVAVPDPHQLRTGARWACSAPTIACALLGFADDYTKLVRRRSLGPARAHEAGRVDRDLARAVVHRRRTRPISQRRCDLRVRRLSASTSAPFYPVLIYLVVAGHDQRGQPHRRPRRPRGGLRRDRAAGLRRHHLHHRASTTSALLAGCLVGGCIGFLWFNAFPATIFMGDTGSLGLGGAIAGLAVMTQTEAAADPARRHLRDRGALGRDPGGLLPDVPQTGLPDGADPPPLRAAGRGRRRRSSCASGSSPRSAPRSASRSTARASADRPARRCGHARGRAPAPGPTWWSVWPAPGSRPRWRCARGARR